MQSDEIIYQLNSVQKSNMILKNSTIERHIFRRKFNAIIGLKQYF